MKYLAIVLVSLFAFQAVTAKKAAKASEAPVQKSQLEELAVVAQNIAHNVTETLGIKDLPDTKQVVDILNNQTQTLAGQVQEIVDKLKSEVKAHEGDVDNVIKQVSAKLTETATALQSAAGPETTAKAKQLKESLDSGLKNTIAEVEKLVKAVQPDIQNAQDNLNKVTKSALDQLVELGKNIQTQVKNTIETHEKTHH